jgi:hypothetical protein
MPHWRPDAAGRRNRGFGTFVSVGLSKRRHYQPLGRCSVADSRVATYKRLLRETAKQLGEKTDTEVVRHVATLRMARENLQVQLLRGERIDPNDLIKLDAALKQYLPQGKPIELTVHFVDKHGTRMDGLPPPDLTPPPTPPTSPPPSDKPSAETSAPLPDNVVPLKRTAAEERALQLERCAPPIKRENEPWRGHIQPNLGAGAPGYCDPFGTYGDVPNFSAPYRGGR